MNKRYNFTVIIPHKNVPNLLQRCVDSIPQRDDVQVIIVDDNSGPTKVDFNHFPGLDRSNTQVIFDKTGKGAGRARNVGLEHVGDTKWLVFADSDDFFTPEFSSIMDKHLNDDADFIYFGVDSVDSDTLEPSIRKNRYYNHFGNGIPVDEMKCKLTTPWAKFIKYDVARKGYFRFTEIPASNDCYFILNCAFASKKIGIDEAVLYVVTDRKNSITTKPSFVNWKARFDEMKRVFAMFKEKGMMKYHANMFAQAYYLIRIKPMALFKYLPQMFWYTPVKYWGKDLGECLKSLKGAEEYKMQARK